jgi:beta-phosphoglucomutase-like phosphatase (HAD superfamily)
VLKAIVFDFDGVIANTEPLHFQAYRDVLAPEGIPLSERDYYDRYLGFDDVGAFEAIARDRGLAAGALRIAELVARKAVRLEQLEGATSVLFPGAADAVRRASAVYPLAIASGARGEEIHRVLARERLAGCFAAIVAAEDTPVSKPAPDPYLRALALLGAAGHPALTARHCVAVEDSLWGLESARAAGMKTVAVTNTYGKSALAGSADLVIATLDAIDLDRLAALCPEAD